MRSPETGRAIKTSLPPRRSESGWVSSWVGSKCGWVTCSCGRLSRMFGRCIELFDDYYRAADAKRIQGFSAPLGCELRERLQQMNWLLVQIQSREDELTTIGDRSRAALSSHINRIKAEGLSYEDTPIPADAQMSREDGYRSIALMDEIRLLVEAFYYFAARARHIVRNMPKLNSFEAVGVRNVHNHLIEHPEGRGSQVLSRSFAFGGAKGPVVKAIRESTETAHPDVGLFTNAQEFADNLTKTLQDAVQMWLN